MTDEETDLLDLQVPGPTEGSLLNAEYVENGSGSFESSGESHMFTRSYSKWSPLEEGVTLTWNDLSVYAHTSKKGRCKRIINGVTGAVKAGSLVALMGASGAGKSTLMAALAYRATGLEVEGDILINGRPIGSYMRHLGGFMHQEDLFVGSLTVLEHMYVMSHLKLDRRTTNAERKHKIQELLKQLRLTESRNTRIGLAGEAKVLSGGEKKRLAFATELLTDPPLLFCDEPTTGLDSYSAQKLVYMMNTMACKGKTIVCTIHQPSSELFNMFSQLILLADGRIAYMGSAANAIEFFHNLGYTCPTSYNPADFFIRTLALIPGAEDASRQAVKKICDHFAVSEYAKEVNVVVQYEFHMGRASECVDFVLDFKYKKVFWWVKLYWLIYRWFLDILRNSNIQTLRILQKIAIAAIAGLCYAGTLQLTQSGIQSIQGALFVFVTENTFTPMYSVLATFPMDMPLFLREYRSGLYSPGIYYISKVIALVPGLIIEPVIFVVIAYWITGLRSTTYAFVMTTVAATLTMNVSTACGILFSNAFATEHNALAYLVPFDYVLMITSGLFVNLSSLPAAVSWTKYFSWLMYATETMTIVQWEAVTNITCDYPTPDIPCVTTGSEVMDRYSFSKDNLNLDIFGMLLLCLIFHALAFICLWWRTKK